MPDPGPARAAVVVTAVDVLPDGRPAGSWLPEVVHPWTALARLGRGAARAPAHALGPAPVGVR